MKQLLYLCLTIFLTSIALPAHSINDQKLYDPKPPADASYVRFINPTSAEVIINGAAITNKTLAAYGTTSYHVISQGEHSMSYQDKQASLMVEPSKYYSVILYDDALMLEDAIIENPAKAGIYFYNLGSDTPVTLYSPKHGTDIFADIAFNRATSRDINPLTLELAIKSTDGDIASLDPLILQRRVNHSIMLFRGGTPRAVIVEHDVAR